MMIHLNLWIVISLMGQIPNICARTPITCVSTSCAVMVCRGNSFPCGSCRAEPPLTQALNQKTCVEMTNICIRM